MNWNQRYSVHGIMFFSRSLLFGLILECVHPVEIDGDNDAVGDRNSRYPDFLSKLQFHRRENKTQCSRCGSHYDTACRTRGQYFIDGDKNYEINFAAFEPRTCPFAPKNILPEKAQNAGDSCESPPAAPCDPNSVYYTLDGSCNNLEIPSWGQAGKPFTRIVKANYSDDFCSLRRGSNGQSLTSSRKIRTTVLTDKEIPSTCFNILYYAFGQWVDHDITLMHPIASSDQCCNGKEPAKDPNPEVCLPTIIPKDDPFYSRFGLKCLDLKRAANTHHEGCRLSPCSPINFQTAFLDLSILYGTSESLLKRLRSFKNGELLYEDGDGTGEDTYPPIAQGEVFCPQGGIDPNAGSYCLAAGDERVNQNPELTLMEIIFMRAHNFVAASLLQHNPNWNDEHTFQEAKRVLTALYQHIITAEHTPSLIGIATAANYALLPLTNGYNTKYSPTINPQTTVEYSFASGRAHHSMVRGTVSYQDSDGKEMSYKLRDKFFNQRFLLSKNVYSNLLSVYLQQKSNRQDEHFTEELTNWLFAGPGGEFGFDLISIDIDRGRDSGAPTYNQMRQACGLCRLSKFEDFADIIMEPDDIPKLKSLYPSVDDVDLYVGGMLEKPIPSSTVGPTFSCIIGENFHRWKFGDRLWFEFPTAKFTPVQVAAIRRTTFAYILCKSNPRMQFVPKNAFMAPSSNNPLIRCDEVEEVDLSVFQENGRSA